MIPWPHYSLHSIKTINMEERTSQILSKSSHIYSPAPLELTNHCFTLLFLILRKEIKPKITSFLCWPFDRFFFLAKSSCKSTIFSQNARIASTQPLKNHIFLSFFFELRCLHRFNKNKKKNIKFLSFAKTRWWALLLWTKSASFCF